MRPARVFSALFGTVFGLVAIGLIVASAAVLLAYGTQRDADGFIESPTYELTTNDYAITSADIDLASRPGDWWPTDVADIRFTTEAATPLFVGIGPSSDVDAYLGGVARSEVTNLGATTTDVTYEPISGTAPAAAPTDQDFWVASSVGADEQSLTWNVDQGEWSIVVMNADGSADIDATVTAGAKIDALWWIAGGVLFAGIVIGGFAAMLLVFGTRQPASGVEEHVAIVPADAYPVVLEGSLDPGLSRWMWLVKWVLVIPHMIVLAFLWMAFVLLTVVAFFAILFTGRYPKSIFDFNVGVLRWSWRVSFYAFSALATDQYPPFTLADADYPARLDIVYPEQLSRGLVLIKTWLLAIPHYLIVGLFSSGLVWWTIDLDGNRVLELGGGLIGLLVFIAAVVLLFSGRYPHGIFDLVMGLNRWSYRVVAYAGLMRDEYPPFRLDLGGEDPASGPSDPGHRPPAGPIQSRDPVMSSS